MPQKAIFSRAPLLACAGSMLSNGQARCEDAAAERLYGWLCERLDAPETWEGAFALACLLRDQPMAAPAAEKIRLALGENDNGRLPGSWTEQLSIVRAGLAVYEYTLDRALLQRLTLWCRALETSWEEALADRMLRICPADWMSFLVRLYRITGRKGILRLCTRLRAEAMDWTTLLHGFRQRQPLEKTTDREEILRTLRDPAADGSDFFFRQAAMNRAEWLADGARYTAWAGIFSGNGQDLSAAEKGWQLIRRDHGAVCGGTTANVLLSGAGANQPVEAAALAAWAEAFADLLVIQDAPWAVNALTRLAMNGLPACIGEQGPVFFQRVNSVPGATADTGLLLPEALEERTTHTLARLGRACAVLWKTAVTPGENGITIQLPLPGRYAATAGGEPVAIRIEEEGLTLRGRDGFQRSIRLFIADTETREIHIETEATAAPGESAAPDNTAAPGKNTVHGGNAVPGGKGVYCSWTGNGDCHVAFLPTDRITVTGEHHEGISCFRANRLLAFDTKDGEYRFAACGEPVMREDQPMLPARRVSQWRRSRGIPGDLPVLPAGEGETVWLPLRPYAETEARIAVFPRTKA